MTQEKIKAQLPAFITVLCDLNKNTTQILHDGYPIDTELKQCGVSLDWYLKDADLLFKTGADVVKLHFVNINSKEQPIYPGYFVAEYKKTEDIASNKRIANFTRNTMYFTRQFNKDLEIEVDANLVETYRKRIAEEEQE